MNYVRVRSYLNNSLLADHAYFGDNQVKALDKFRNEYPEHNGCILVAETVDDEEENMKEWFKAARACDCVHCF